MAETMMTLGQRWSLGHAGSCYCSFVSCAEMERILVKTEIEIVIIIHAAVQ